VKIRVSPSTIDQRMTDPGAGEHLWVMAAAFQVADSTIKAMNEGKDPGDQHMDHENLISLQGPGCYKCEEPYSKRMALRRCKGTMDMMP
jgi:hypothetical protein